MVHSKQELYPFAAPILTLSPAPGRWASHWENKAASAAIEGDAPAAGDGLQARLGSPRLDKCHLLSPPERGLRWGMCQCSLPAPQALLLLLSSFPATSLCVSLPMQAVQSPLEADHGGGIADADSSFEAADNE